MCYVSVAQWRDRNGVSVEIVGTTQGGHYAPPRLGPTGYDADTTVVALTSSDQDCEGWVRRWCALERADRRRGQI